MPATAFHGVVQLALIFTSVFGACLRDWDAEAGRLRTGSAYIGAMVTRAMSRARWGPSVVHPKEHCPDQSAFQLVDCQDRVDVGAAIGLAPRRLGRVLRRRLAPALCWKGNPGEDVCSASSTMVASPDTIGQVRSVITRELVLAASAEFWVRAVTMRAEITRRPLLPAPARAVNPAWRRAPCRVTVMDLETGASCPRAHR